MPGMNFYPWSIKCGITDESAKCETFPKNVTARNYRNISRTNPSGNHVAEPCAPDNGTVHCPAIDKKGDNTATGEDPVTNPLINHKVYSL